jgi:hypothetical protein
MLHLATFSRSVVIAAFLSAAGCTSAVDIHTMTSPGAHFEHYRTVAFDIGSEPPSQYSSSAQSAEVRAHVYETALSLIVRIEVGRRERRVPVNTSIGMPPSVPPAVEPEYAGIVPYHGPLDEEEKDLIEGAFVIDAFDGKSHELVWHGSAHTEIKPGSIDYDGLRHAVETVLAPFPHPAK